MTPDKFLARLCALVPPPGFHQTRYYGVFANRHRLRARIIPPSVVPAPGQQFPLGLTAAADGEPAETTEAAALRPRRLGWANLLARVFAVDVTRCRACGGRMRVVSVVTDPDDIARILHGARAPPRPPRPQPQARWCSPFHLLDDVPRLVREVLLLPRPKVNLRTAGERSRGELRRARRISVHAHRPEIEARQRLDPGAQLRTRQTSREPASPRGARLARRPRSTGRRSSACSDTSRTWTNQQTRSIIGALPPNMPARRRPRWNDPWSRPGPARAPAVAIQQGFELRGRQSQPGHWRSMPHDQSPPYRAPHEDSGAPLPDEHD